MRTKRIAISGFFNPIHIGHIRMIQESAKLGNVYVIINNDEQVKLKGSTPFMNEEDRREIVSNIKGVYKTVISFDTDKSIGKTLRWIAPDIFANGGDRKDEDDIPESKICKELGIKMIFNIGGNKIRSSSELLKKL